MTSAEDAVLLDGGGRAVVHRRDDTVIRDAGFWTPPAEADNAADSAAATPELTAHPVALWAMAWRARSAAWLLRNREALEAALTAGAC
jgi:hypothetical protein